VGANVQAVLCEHDNYQGVCETCAADDPDLGDNAIGANRVSAVKVQRRQPTPTPTSPRPTATPTSRPPTSTPTPPPAALRRNYLPVVRRALPLANALRNGDFEQGRGAGWQEYSTHGWPIVFPADDLPVTPRSGNWASKCNAEGQPTGKPTTRRRNCVWCGVFVPHRLPLCGVCGMLAVGEQP